MFSSRQKLIMMPSARVVGAVGGARAVCQVPCSVLLIPWTSPGPTPILQSGLDSYPHLTDEATRRLGEVSPRGRTGRTRAQARDSSNYKLKCQAALCALTDPPNATGSALAPFSR